MLVFCIKMIIEEVKKKKADKFEVYFVDGTNRTC